MTTNEFVGRIEIFFFLDLTRTADRERKLKYV